MTRADFIDFVNLNLNSCGRTSSTTFLAKSPEEAKELLRTTKKHHSTEITASIIRAVMAHLLMNEVDTSSVEVQEVIRVYKVLKVGGELTFD